MYVTIDKEKCIGCNACIRVCPVQDANTAEPIDHIHSIINVNPEKCIGCGECVKSCDHGARTYTDDTDRFFADLQSGKDITVLVAPAFMLTEPSAGAMLNKLKEMGVNTIYDVSYGADICTYMHIKAVKEHKVGKVMSQPCAAITEYILKYRHDLLKNLSPIHSPISCAAVYLRKYENVSGPIACISPCIAKKHEFEETGLIQYNVTFKRLKEFLKNKNYQSSSNEFKFSNPESFCGQIYPKPGGLKDCLLHAMPSLDVRNAEGVQHIYNELSIYAATPEDNKPDVYDVLSCGNGCISGPGTNFDEGRLFFYLHNAAKAGSKAFKEREKQTFAHMDKQFKWFDKHLNLEDFMRTYTPKNLSFTSISNAQIEQAYNELQKYSYAEKHFDCHACGYKSCEEMAIAIAKGLNIPQNCHQFTLKRAEETQKQSENMQNELIEQNAQVLETADGIKNEVSTINDGANRIVNQCDDIGKTMSELSQQIDALTQCCDELGSAMQVVSETNDKNREMSESIKDISDQTHILSINAAVEAARAGEVGKTFAIVATEIRNLASNTRKATEVAEENDAEVKEAIKKVEDLKNAITDATNSLTKTLGSLQDNVRETSETSAEINNAAEGIVKSVDVLENITR